MILPDQTLQGSSKSSESDSVPALQISSVLPPPSYVQEDGPVHPLDKTPLAFPAPEDNTIVLNNVNLDPGFSSSSYYATPSASGSRARSKSPQPPTSSGASIGREFSSSSSSSSYYDPGSIPLPFSRTPPTDLPYTSFKPIFLIARGKILDKGFPPAPPPSTVQPHPFTSHDVSEGDWISFLEALQDAATLTDRDIRRSRLPIVGFIPVVGYLSTLGVQQYMRHHKGSRVAKVIDMWNHHFFSLRKVRVILMKGKVKVSGLNDLPVHGEQLAMEPSNEAPVTPDDDIYRLFVVSI